MEIFKKGYDMALTRAMELDLIKDTDIVVYLESKAYRRGKTSFKIAWFYAEYRGEKEPSLAVYYRKKPMDFYDFGIAKGGSIIDLVMIMIGCDYVTALRELRKELGLKWGNV